MHQPCESNSDSFTAYLRSIQQTVTGVKMTVNIRRSINRLNDVILFSLLRNKVLSLLLHFCLFFSLTSILCAVTCQSWLNLIIVFILLFIFCRIRVTWRLLSPSLYLSWINILVTEVTVNISERWFLMFEKPRRSFKNTSCCSDDIFTLHKDSFNCPGEKIWRPLHVKNPFVKLWLLSR